MLRYCHLFATPAGYLEAEDVLEEEDGCVCYLWTGSTVSACLKLIILLLTQKCRACVSAAVRLAVTVKYGKAADALYALAPLVFWATAEMTCGFFIVCVPCIPKILKETGVIRNIKRAFGMSTAPTNPNTADRYAKSGTKGSQLSSTGPKSYYKLDEDGVPLGTLKGSESTEYLRGNVNNGQGITRTTQIKITQDNRSTSDSEGHAAFPASQKPWGV